MFLVHTILHTKEHCRMSYFCFCVNAYAHDKHFVCFIFVQVFLQQQSSSILEESYFI